MCPKNRDLGYTTAKAKNLTYFQDCWSDCTCAAITKWLLDVDTAVMASSGAMTSSCVIHVRTSKL